MSKVKAITADIIENNYTRRLILKVLIVGLAVISILYIYFIGSITFNILARKSLETSIVKFNGNISQLELTYLSHLNEIDRNYATSMGFVESSDNIFVTRSVNRVAVK